MAAKAALTAAFTLTVAFGGMALSQPNDFQLVVHPSSGVSRMSKKELSLIFLKRKSSWPDGSAAVPIDQRLDSGVRESFSQSVLGKSVAAVESYWNGQVFSGKATPPETLRTDREVIDLVSRTPGAVGYVSAGTPLSGAKALQLED